MADRLHIMFDRQKEFQDLAFGPLFTDTAQRIAVCKDLMLHLHSECTEYMAELDWNPKRRASGKVIPSNLLNQNIDIIKLAFALAITWGFTEEDIFHAFIEKSSVVEQRFEQEFPLQEIVKSGARVVAIDIDGVLADYPRCFYDWVLDNTHCGTPDYDELDAFVAFGGELGPVEIAILKDEYRQSGAKRTLPTMQGSIGFTQAVRNMGYKVVLLTSRPVKKYSRLFADTMFWLNQNHFAFDAVLWDEKKECRLVEEFGKQVRLFVDDDEHNTSRVSASGIPVWEFKKNSCFANILKWMEETENE